MGQLLKTHDIDEFSETLNIPDSAISNEILENVRRLDEENHLEKAFREILYDPNETPHGPTEIADILTSLHIHGTKKTAAFVLKGKSFSKVSSQKVSHQFLKLRQLPNLGLAVFAAVGNIQDDAQRDFIQTAIDIGCDYLILDAHEISKLMIAYEKICPKDGTVYGNSGNCQYGHPLDAGQTIEIEIKENYQYTITQQKDVSHGGAKRYSATILTDRHYQKELIRVIINEATEKLKSSNYYRNDTIKARWAKNPANVIWLFVAYDINDINNSNWACRSCWIDPNLDASMKPLPLSGDENVNGIEISWNTDYKTLKDIIEGHAGSKEDYINGINEILTEIKKLAELSIQQFKKFQQGDLAEDAYIKSMEYLGAKIDDLYSKSDNLPLPPDDCIDYDQVCHNIFAIVHDISLYFSKNGQKQWSKKNCNWLMQNTIERYQEELRKLEYEESKIH